jgi:hypothetical protein
MNPNVRRDVVALHGRGSTAAPLTGQVKIISALATDMTFADMFLFRVSSRLAEDEDRVTRSEPPDRYHAWIYAGPASLSTGLISSRPRLLRSAFFFFFFGGEEKVRIHRTE